MTARFETFTSRLRLRELTLDDAEFVLRLLNEPSFVENIGDRGVRDLEGARTYLLDGPLTSYRENGFGLWWVGRREDGVAVGIAGLIRRAFLDDVDLGYALLPEFTGLGYAREAAAGILEHARADFELHRVIAIVQAGNARSIHLLERLGFTADGTVTLPGTDETLVRYAREV